MPPVDPAKVGESAISAAATSLIGLNISIAPLATQHRPDPVEVEVPAITSSPCQPAQPNRDIHHGGNPPWITRRSRRPGGTLAPLACSGSSGSGVTSHSGFWLLCGR